MASDVDSPVVVKKKRVFARNAVSLLTVASLWRNVTVTSVINESVLQLDETQDEAASDEDFQNDSVFACRTSVPGVKRKEMQQVRDQVCSGAFHSKLLFQPFFLIVPKMYAS